MNGVDLIRAERVRQIHTEGYTAKHDDAEHNIAGLLHAAIGYIGNANAVENYGVQLVQEELPVDWPEGWEYKPKSVRTDLIRAGALIAAAIDMYDRSMNE